MTVFPPLILAAAGMSVAIHYNDSDEGWLAALVCWIIGWLFALVAVAAWELAHGRPVFGRPGPKQPPWRRTELLVLAVVLVLAAVLRIVALEVYPIMLHNDEMSCLLEARGFLGEDTSLFDTGWFNCPNLGFFLTSIPMHFVEPSLVVHRSTSVFFALLSLLATYLIVRRLFGVRPALLLLIMTTPFHWHLHFSRTGFHYMQAAALTAVALLLFVLALDRRSPVLFGCAGVVTGIAWQTYYAAWLIPILLAAWAIARLVSDRTVGWAPVKGLGITLALFLVTVAPLFAHYVEKPSAAAARTTSVFVFSDERREHVEGHYGSSEPITVLANQARRLGILLVGGGGDTSVQYGLQGQFIDPYLLPLFLAGLAYALTLIRTPGGQLLWIWFLGTVIAGGLLTIDAPFSPRLTVITPVILLFPALLIDRVLRIDWIASRRPLITVAWLVFGLLIVGSAWWNLHTTFVRHPNASLHGNRDFIVRLAADLDDVRSIATFTDPEDFTHQAYLALLPGVEGLNLAPSEDLFEDQFETVRSLGPGTLVIYPLGEETYYGLCDRLERTTGGVVLTRGGLAGFEWCYVE